MADIGPVGNASARDGTTIADVAASAAASLGLTGFADRLGLGPAQHVVICLVDGLGWHQLQDHRDRAPTLARLEARAIGTVFPSTTPTALASLGTGLLPGAHGLVGGSFWLPEASAVLAPLKWKAEPHPLAVQPEPTVFERAERHGVQVTTVAPAAYATSGLTRAALRGGAYRPAEDVATRVREVMTATAGNGPTLTYVYWAELDRVGHDAGIGSGPWLAALSRVDDLVRRLSDALPGQAALVVTSDHGMVNCDTRIDIEGEPDLIADIRCLAGEPRARHAYASAGRQAAVAERWRQRLAGQAQVLTRDQVIADGLIGPAEDWVAERIGDVVAIAHDDVALVSSVDRRVSSLRGQHGGLTEAEVAIPCAIVRT